MFLIYCKIALVVFIAGSCFLFYRNSIGYYDNNSKDIETDFGQVFSGSLVWPLGLVFVGYCFLEFLLKRILTFRIKSDSKNTEIKTLSPAEYDNLLTKENEEKMGWHKN